MIPTKPTTCLVTGGSSGIGLSIARTLLRDGFHVTICGRSLDRLDRATHELESHPRLSTSVCDVADPAAVAELFAPFRERGRLDVLVNAAGILNRSSVVDMPPELLDELTRVNYYGTVYCCQQAVPIMRKRGAGTIFNLASIAGIRGLSDISAYSASKFAVRGFTQSLHQEVKRDGIKVTSVCPGYVWTPMVHGVDIDRADMIQASDIAELIRSMLKLSPSAVVSEIVIDRLSTV